MYFEERLVPPKKRVNFFKVFHLYRTKSKLTIDMTEKYYSVVVEWEHSAKLRPTSHAKRYESHRKDVVQHCF